MASSVPFLSKHWPFRREGLHLVVYGKEERKEDLA
jgi:hypothetical protein